VRRPYPSPAELHDYLTSQPQLGLDRSPIASSCSASKPRAWSRQCRRRTGPAQLTAEGTALHARLAEAVAAVTRRVYAGLDPDDLVTTHRVLVEVTERARRLREQP
jgi:hypothetical protein